MEDLRVALEDWFGRNGGAIPSSIEDVVRKGEEKLDERIKMLKLADKGGWEAVDAYVTEPVCDDDEDDKKWKRAVRSQFGEVCQGTEVDMVDIMELVGEVALVDIGDLQGWHILEAGVSLVREGM